MDVTGEYIKNQKNPQDNQKNRLLTLKRSMKSNYMASGKFLIIEIGSQR